MYNQFKFVIIFLIVGASCAFSQITLGIPYIIDIYKPYTPETQYYMKINDKVSSKTSSLYVNVPVFDNEKVIWRIGLSFKHIRHKVDDKLKAYYYTMYGNGVTTFTHTEKVNQILDLKSKSNSFGIMNEFSYKLHNIRNFRNDLGLVSEVFLLEFYHSDYYYNNSGKVFYSPDIRLVPMTSTLSSPFLFSSANLSLFYRIRTPEDLTHLAAKFIVGTNLYSDWDQFQKYAWVGVGLEMGFGKFQMFK